MLRFLIGVLFLFASGAQAMERVEVGETRFSKATLTIAGRDGEKSYDQAGLEALGTYGLETVTPWRKQPARFVGVRLMDLLHAHGLAEVTAIRVIAENDYAVTIQREDWQQNDVLVATRVNGKGHSRRERGPIQFIFDMSSNPRLGDEVFQSNWVWMASRIEIAD